MAIHPVPDLHENVPDLKAKLTDGGMADRRAEVYARSLKGQSNAAIAEALDIDKSAVSHHLSGARNDIQEAKSLVSVTATPDYVSVLPEGATQTLYESDAIDGGVMFRIHNPDNHYQLGGGGVIEGHHLDDDNLLLLHHQRRGYQSKVTGIQVGYHDLTRFLYDWVVSDRFDPITAEENTNEWFVTGEIHEPEWLASELRTLGVESVEAMTDGRFVSPLDDDGVFCGQGAESGLYPSGYKIGYEPTDTEIAELLEAGDIDEETANRLCRKPVEDLREISTQIQ